MEDGVDPRDEGVLAEVDHYPLEPAVDFIALYKGVGGLVFEDVVHDDKVRPILAVARTAHGCARTLGLDASVVDQLKAIIAPERTFLVAEILDKLLVFLKLQLDIAEVFLCGDI